MLWLLVGLTRFVCEQTLPLPVILLVTYKLANYKGVDARGRVL